MEKSKRLISIYRNYNNVEIYEDVVVKTFFKKERFERELAFYNLFSKYFSTPRLIELDEQNFRLIYERIKGSTLEDPETLEKVSAERIFALRNSIPMLEGETRLNILFSYMPRQIIDGKLVHGDFRVANIIMEEHAGNLYLIDFELGNYAFRELDDAYMYMSLAAIDRPKARAYLNLILSSNCNKAKFLYGVRYFMQGLMRNKLVNDETIKMYKDIENELVTLLPSVQGLLRE